MNYVDNYTKDSKNVENLVETTKLLNFMAESAMIFSGFAIIANNTKERVSRLEHTISELESNHTIEWTTLSIIASKIGLTKDAVRKQLQNGDFEEDVDFKRDGNKIVVHQGAIGRLQRKRRSNNG